MRILKTILFILVSLTALKSFSYVDRSGEIFSESNLKYTGEYLITSLGEIGLNPEKVTHVIVVGSSMNKDSDQFFQSGLLQGYKYKEVYPTHQVVLISAPDVTGKDNDEVFKIFNLSILKRVNSTFNAYRLVTEMLYFSKIASFDFYGHSSPWAVKLAKKNGTISPGGHADQLKKLNSHFTPLAYATLNGCNGGFNLAGKLSEVWKIPVSGSLTSTLFEKLQKDGWYKKSDRTEGESLDKNSLSFKDPKDCSMGVCYRLKTSRKNYSSYWGSFKEGGLSFPKFFCNFENTNNRCEKSMALSLVSFPSIVPIDLNSDLSEFKTVLFDYLCSTAKDKKYIKKCIDGITNAVSMNTTTFKMHPGNALHCDFKKCDASVVCKYRRIFGKGPKPGTCHLSTKPNNNPTTLVREYQAFLTGWKFLK